MEKCKVMSNNNEDDYETISCAVNVSTLIEVDNTNFNESISS